MTESTKLGAIQEDGTIIILRDLDPDEYEEYQKARSRILGFVSDRNIFEILLRNHQEFKDYMKHGVELQSASKLRIEFMTEANRKIMNLLSSFKSFIDYSEARITRDKTTNKLTDFRTLCSSYYDNVFSYRFLSLLRHYVQHCGMPIGRIHQRSTIADLESKTIKVTISIAFSRDELLRDFHGWKTVRQELVHQPDTIEIEPHFDTLIQCVEQINGWLIQNEFPEIENAAKLLDSLIKSSEGEGATHAIRLRNAVTGKSIENATDSQDAAQISIELERIPIVNIDLGTRVINVKV